MTNLPLPEQMRQFVRHLNGDVFARVRQHLQTAEVQQENNLQEARSILDAAQEEFDQEKQELRSDFELKKNQTKQQLDQEVASLSKLRQRGMKIQEEAEAHLKKLGKSSPSDTAFLDLNRYIESSTLTDAENLLHQANDECDQLKKEGDSSGAVITGIFFFLVGLLLLVLGLNGGDSISSLVFFLGFVLSAVGGGILVKVYDGVNRIKRTFLDITRNIRRAEAILELQILRSQTAYEASVNQLESEESAKLNEVVRQSQKVSETYEETVAAVKKEFQVALDNGRNWLRNVMHGDHGREVQLIQASGYSGITWNNQLWQQWQPATSPKFIACFGKLTPPAEDIKCNFPDLDLNFFLPALIPFNDGKCLLIEASDTSKKDATQCLQSVLLRLLATIPPGKLNFTFIDPVGLGQNVAAFMKLAEYDESLIKSRAWTEPQHIEQRLAELTEHMENVIQKYLRTDYKNIEAYNAQAGEVAEPYRVLVVMDFPTNFSETAARRLVSIANNGPRCGVYTLVMMDTSKKLPHGFNLSDLERHSFVIHNRDGEFVWDDDDFRICRLMLDTPPDNQLTNRIVEGVGAMAKEAMKVEVPFIKLLTQAGLEKMNWWSGSTERNLQVPLGPTGARKLQMFTFGEGLTHHGLIVGRPGSGKTNLMHVIITTLALKYPPEELQLYLVDFKKGVGFKPYADFKLPHAVAIAIESEREFGLSVLQGLDAEMQRRGELFRSQSVEDLSEYRRKTDAVMPRILLVADEFQEFFTHSDNLATQAGILLDRLTRQGRAFGIHILLGTQTLQGSNSLPKSTLNQIALRIALQCSADDSRIVLSDDNPAARLLSRPGEAIYNSANGLVEGNNFFQVALFTDEDRRLHLQAVQMLAEGDANRTEPIVFEGNEPARIEHCRVLNNLLSAANYPAPSKAVNAWLGEPTAIREPVVARLRRQSGSNLLIVSRDEEEGLGILTAAQLSLVAQHTPERAKFYTANFVTADTPWAELPDHLAALVPHPTNVFNRRQLPKLFKELLNEVNQRIQAPRGDLPALYLLIAGLHRARDLRQDDGGYNDDGINANELFVSLLREGPEVGLHVIAWCDSYANLMRVLSRRQIGEFGLRVAAAMSNDDSQNLLDDSAAAKFDRPHRAVLYDEERPGLLEKLRPYSLPSQSWLRQLQATFHWRAARINNYAGSSASFSD